MTHPLGPNPNPAQSTSAGSAVQGALAKFPGWLWIAALLIPVMIYWVLPAIGITSLGEALSFNMVVALMGLLVGGSLYWAYLRVVLPKPVLPLGFIVLAWPIVDHLNGELLSRGLNLHLRPLLILALALPATWMIWQERKTLWRHLPGLKVYVMFMLWLTLYAFVYNANAVDPRLSGGEEAMSEGSVSMVQWTAYFYGLLSMAIAGVAILKAKDYKGLFDGLNKALLWVSSAEALLTIAGFPFGVFTLFLDGFTRAIGIFSHPNPFSHHMGVLMVYLLGLFCYYQGHRKHRLPAWLLYGGIALNFCAFLLGLSKTAISVFVICAVVVFLMNMAVPAVRSSFGKILVGLLILLPLGVFAFEALSGQSFLSLMESRIDQTQSMTWRVIVWQDLIADINMATVWLGHGFTAANETVYRLTFSDAKNAQPLMMVHNAYIALLYDLGLPGYLLLLAAVAMLWQGIRGWLQAPNTSLRTAHATIVALVIYFLSVCAFDEMSYMFDAPQLFWALATMLACVTIREQAEAQNQPPEPQEFRLIRNPAIPLRKPGQRASRQTVLELLS